MSGFTSNFSRSKSLRYSMARGLGGKEGSGRDEDIAVSKGSMEVVVFEFSRRTTTDFSFYTEMETIMCQIRLVVKMPVPMN